MTKKVDNEELLKLFRDKAGAYISGEEISQLLGVSRTAVWKKIKLLRQMGYTIDAVPSRGYHLAASPDALLVEEIRSDLGTRVVGKEVIFLEQTDSTNVRAREQGDGGAPEGTVIIADSQSAGKGRLGRTWESPAGVNLYTSVLLRPVILPRFGTQMTFLSAVAVAAAIEEVSGLSATVKWPNDVLLGGKKVAGLLNEMNAETERVNYVILGIGVNLNMQPGQFPDDLRYPATSVAIEKGSPVSRLAFARSLFRHLDSFYQAYLEQGVTPVLRAWEELCDVVGKRVSVDCQSQVFRGVVEGLDPDGALLLRTDEGPLEKILAGDVKPE